MKKKKVAVLSIYDLNNYGNRLQNYAMQSILKKLDFIPCTITGSFDKKSKIQKLKEIICYESSILQIIVLTLKREERAKNFVLFENKNIKLDKIKYNFHCDSEKLNLKYDKFIVGSDQVWHPEWFGESYFFLDFVKNREYSIAYAASMGVSSLDNESKANYKKWMKNIANISVREDVAKEIVKELIDKDVPVLIDPTMLIDVSEWSRVERCPKNFNISNYMVIYYLGEISKSRQQMIDKISNIYNLKVIILGKKEYRDYYSAGPSEFLYLIHNAKIVFTDSFHACVFSMLFGVPFYVFEREDNCLNMNSRIDTFLNKFKLNNRYIINYNQNIELICDYSNSYKILNEERKKALMFLEKSLYK